MPPLASAMSWRACSWAMTPAGVTASVSFWALLLFGAATAVDDHMPATTTAATATPTKRFRICITFPVKTPREGPTQKCDAA